MLELAAAVARFAGALVELAARERDTPMPDYTYLQAAQPTTAGHWLLSFAYPALRDLDRLRGDFAWVNRSPGGAGGVNGSRFALDRARIAALLGFDGPIAHTRDAMWQTDGLADLVSHAAIAATGASRFAEDLELYGSEEFGLLRIGDELCRASALMPQKRNPYALVVLRGGAGTLIGRATGVLATQRTPSGRTDNLLYAYGEVARLGRARGAAAAPGRRDRGERHVRSRAGGARGARELRARDRPRRGDQPGDGPRLPLGVPRRRPRGGGRGARRRGARRRRRRAARAARSTLDPAFVADALDPAAAIASRIVPGGAAPEPMDAMLRECRDAVAEVTAWVDGARAAADAAEARSSRSSERTAG